MKKETRPALIVQNDTANCYSPVTIVAAIFSKFDNKLYPTEVLIKSPEGGLTAESVVLLNQLRTIDKVRLVKRLDTLKTATMEEMKKALLISLDCL